MFFIGLFIGLLAGIFVVALMQANDVRVQTCPKCKGVCGFETAPGDWHDCDLCDATGFVRVLDKATD